MLLAALLPTRCAGCGAPGPSPCARCARLVARAPDGPVPPGLAACAWAIRAIASGCRAAATSWIIGSKNVTSKPLASAASASAARSRSCQKRPSCTAAAYCSGFARWSGTWSSHSERPSGPAAGWLRD